MLYSQWYVSGLMESGMGLKKPIFIKLGFMRRVFMSVRKHLLKFVQDGTNIHLSSVKQMISIELAWLAKEAIT